MTLGIRAALAVGKGQPLTFEQIDLEGPRAGEVLVRLVASGLCETDIMIRDEWYPFPLPAVLGHEGAGIVEAVGEGVRRVSPGDHVALSFSACRVCSACRRGRTPYCQQMLERNLSGRRADGTTAYHRLGVPLGGHFFGQSSFATHTVVDQHDVVKVAPDVPLEVVAPFGCGVETGAGAVFYALRPVAGAGIAVFGAGLIGLSAVMAAKAVGCSTIIAVDPDQRRRELARASGATQVVDPTEDDPVDRIRALSDGGVDFSVETSGNAEILRAAVDATGAFGTCAVIGPAPVGSEAVLDVNMLLFGRSLRGVIGGDVAPEVCIPALLALHRQGRFPVDRLLRHYDFADINAAIGDIAAGDVLKPVIRIAD